MNTPLEPTLPLDAPLAYRAMGAAPGTAKRLLLLAHGVGGNETNLAGLGQQVAGDTLVVLPRGPLTFGQGQFGWFQVVFGSQGPAPDLVAAEHSRQVLIAFIAALQAALSIPPARTVMAGFSQGGIMSASVALTRPDLVAGFGVLSGRILPELEPQVADRTALSTLNAFIGHDLEDSKLPVEWAHRSDAWLTRLGVPHETRLYPGDHGIPAAMQADFLAWLDSM